MLAMGRVPISRVLPLALALLVTGYAGLLRLDAFVAKYGALEHPSWARMLTRDVAPIVPYLHPKSIGYRPEANPYVGGDPINYLRSAREMRGFYQAHVREPLFLALTRGCLWLLEDQDAGVSLSSLIGSMLAVFGTYLLGAAIVSPHGGVAAAFAMAIEYDNITWAVDGWRDDTFTAAVAFALWALVRFRRSPTFANAATVGVTAAAACLTRITALSFVLPALLWIAFDCPRAERRERANRIAAAALVLAALVGPYLVNCAIATGDPFYAINYHTSYYRFHEGLPSSEPMSAANYVWEKFASRPLGTVDTGVMGVLAQPFVTKWGGFEVWMTGLGVLLAWAALAGLLRLLFTADGRLLIVVVIGSLLPYAFAWSIPGGTHWRFTMHAYPVFIVAAFYGMAGAYRAVARLRQGHLRPDPAQLRTALRAAAVTVLVVGTAGAAAVVLPWFVVREAAARGQDVSVESGWRDVMFFRGAWSPARREGAVSVRVSTGERALVRLPLPERRAYDLVLRLDPVAPDRQQRLTVLFNGQLVAALPFSWDSQRMGSYRLRIPGRVVHPGGNELILVPDVLVPAASAGPR